MATTDANQQATAKQVSEPVLNPELATGISTAKKTKTKTTTDAVLNPELAAGISDASQYPASTAVSYPTAPTADTSTIGGVTAASTYAPGKEPVAPVVPPAPVEPKVGSAIVALREYYTSIGLGAEVADAVAGLKQEGYDQDTINLFAQNPESVKSADPYIKAFATAMQNRFSANTQRIKNGFAPLSPTEYIAKENSYRQIMRDAGLPAGFYDTNTALSGWIADNVSTATLTSKVALASDLLNNSDQALKDQAKYLYGLDDSHMLAHILDPEAALPLIQKQVNMVQLGAAASREGVMQDKATLEQLNAMNVSQAAAAKGFSSVAAALPASQAIASRFSPYGNAGQVGQELVSQQLGTTTAAGETPAQVAERLRRQQMQESNLFGGSAGASQQGQSLGIGTAQGVS